MDVQKELKEVKDKLAFSEEENTHLKRIHEEQLAKENRGNEESKIQVIEDIPEFMMSGVLPMQL